MRSPASFIELSYHHFVFEHGVGDSYLVYPGCYNGRSQEVKEKKLDILKKDKRMNETQEIKTLNETRG